MARYYNFAIIRLAPDDARDERLNIGAVVLNEHGLDVRISKKLEKARVISSAIDIASLRLLVDNLEKLDERFRSQGLNSQSRVEMISRVGPITLSKLGTFEAASMQDYEARLQSIMKSMVDPEPALNRHKEKRSKLLTQVKSIFRKEGVLAKKDEDIESHRIVTSFEIETGLTADLVLKNGAMHVVETIDVTGDADSSRRAFSEIGIASLVLESARMKFGDKLTKAQLVYDASSSLERIALPALRAAEHQGATLTNWASADERQIFVHSLASLATPYERKSNRSARRFSMPSSQKFVF